MSRNKDVICLCFCNTTCDNAHTNFGYQLHRHATAWIGTFQVIDELFEVLNGVDIVVRWWGDEANTSSGVTRAGNRGRYFVAGEFTTLAGFRALCHFDLQFIGICEIVRGDSEATRSDLLNCRAHGIPVI